MASSTARQPIEVCVLKENRRIHAQLSQRVFISYFRYILFRGYPPDFSPSAQDQSPYPASGDDVTRVKLHYDDASGTDGAHLPTERSGASPMSSREIMVRKKVVRNIFLFLFKIYSSTTFSCGFRSNLSSCVDVWTRRRARGQMRKRE